MASIIGIKDIRWCDIRKHLNNHAAMKANDKNETIAKSRTYREARIRHACLLIHAAMNIPAEELHTVTEA